LEQRIEAPTVAPSGWIVNAVENDRATKLPKHAGRARADQFAIVNPHQVGLVVPQLVDPITDAPLQKPVSRAVVQGFADASKVKRFDGIRLRDLMTDASQGPCPMLTGPVRGPKVEDFHVVSVAKSALISRHPRSRHGEPARRSPLLPVHPAP
jgi:hypothetical protein